MSKTFKKVILIIILFLIAFSFINILNQNYSNATVLDISGNKYKPATMENAGEMQETGNKIIGYIQLIGSILSVIILIVLGIKYMAGSVEEKADYKKTMIPYVIGAVMIFGITNLLAIINTIVVNALIVNY